LKIQFLLSLIIINLICLDVFSKDKGIGVLFFKCSMPELQSKSDFIDIFDSTFTKKLGKFSYNPHALDDRFKITSNFISDNQLIEFDYETEGLPIQKLFDKEIKVIFGIDKNSNPVYGWVKFNPKSMSFYLWKDYLIEKALYFTDSPNMYLFFSIPNGDTVRFSLTKDTSEYSKYDEKEFIFNYIMYPIEAQGNWLKVKVVTPADYCAKVVNPRKKILWVRYLDDNGRPLVWYYTRDC